MSFEDQSDLSAFFPEMNNQDDGFPNTFTGQEEEPSYVPQDDFPFTQQNISYEAPEESAFIDTTQESDDYAKWKKAHQEKLQKKAESIRKEKQNLSAEAKKELDNFYAKRKQSVQKAQESTSDTPNSKETKGGQWEKVASYCDLKPRPDAGKNIQQKKNEKMRTILIDLKNTEKTAEKK